MNFKKILAVALSAVMAFGSNSVAYATTDSTQALKNAYAAAETTNTNSNKTSFINVSATEQYTMLRIVPEVSGFVQYYMYISSTNAKANVKLIKDFDPATGKYQTIRDQSINTSTGDMDVESAAYMTKGISYYLLLTEQMANITLLPEYAEHSVSLYPHNHTYKAHTAKNGRYDECTMCKHRRTYTKIKSVSVSTRKYTYNGKVKKPRVIVKDAKGKTVSSKYYTVKYPSGRKNVGRYDISVKMKGYPYYGSYKTKFYIMPTGTSVKSVSGSRKALTVKWKKKKAQVTGYQIQYSTAKNFKRAKTVTVGKKSTTSKKIKKLKAKKKYYVRVRTYKKAKVNGKTKTFYSGWSKAKSIKTK